MGWVQTFGCMLTYFIIMNDYGFSPFSLFFLVSEKGYGPSSSDNFDATNKQTFGNTKIQANCLLESSGSAKRLD